MHLPKSEDVMNTITRLLSLFSKTRIPDSEIGEIPSRFDQTPISVFVDLEFGSNPFTEIYWAIQKHPKRLIIQFSGGGKILHEATLSIYHLLQASKTKGLKIKTVAWGSLLDGALLLFLCGDERQLVNPSAYFEIKSLKRLKSVEWDDTDDFTPRDFTQQPQDIQLYQEVFRLLNAYLPAEEVADKRIMLSGLGEYGLMDGEECPLHKFLMR